MQPKFALAVLALSCSLGTAWADEPAAIPEPVVFSELAAKCAPKVNHQTLKGLIGNESSYNPYAIGVVDGRLERQPQSLNEAVATAERLEREGYKFSMGMGQLYVNNMHAMGMTYAQAFDPCQNLQAISELLVSYYTAELSGSSDKQEALRKAFSRYYSGNPTRGFVPDKEGDPSYVQKVVSGALNAGQADPIVPAVEATDADTAIPVAVTSGSSAARAARAHRGPQAVAGQWVIVTPDPSAEAQNKPVEAADDQATDDDGDDAADVAQEPVKKPPLKVALNTGDDDGAQPVAEFQRPKAPVKKAARAPAAAPKAAEASFVQIIN
ncbi:lytic transglycosylase domain-containing protein [Pseudomonas gingeri]